MTAIGVGFARAAASCRPLTTPPLHDATAARWLPAALRPFVPRGAVSQSIARVASLGLVDHIALRTAAIDEALVASGGVDKEALTEPLDQVVLLGAGLDARAYRLSLDRATVYEVDHPASQASKVARVRGLTPRCRSLVHVAVDFVADDLDAALAAAGHDDASATAWVLEGVTMYLDASSTEALLEVVARRSASGSLLAITYMRPPLHPLPHLVRRLGDIALTRIGEPLRATFRPEALATRLRAVGFEPRSDTCSIDWAVRFGDSRSATMARAFRAERLVIAERQ